MPNKPATSGRDRQIALIAARQHGIITRAQLLAVGLLPSGISDRANGGRLHRIHRGVYAVGHPNLGNEGRWMAAVLACGEGAVLSHVGAAELWGMLPGRRLAAAGAGDEGPPSVDVSVPSDGGRSRRKGIRVHRSRTLSPADCTRRAAIPVTKPGRTIEDLRRVLPRMEFAVALREAEFLQLPIGSAFSPDHTRSELEARFLGLIRRHRLPQPEVNVKVDQFVVDFLWEAERLIVELDGWNSHRSRSAFEQDRARDARLTVLGYEVVRFTWRQIEQDSAAVAGTVRRLLRRWSAARAE